MKYKALCILLSLSMIAPSPAAIYAEETAQDTGYDYTVDDPEDMEEAADEDLYDIQEDWDDQVVADDEVLYEDGGIEEEAEEPAMAGEDILEGLITEPLQSAAEETVEEAKAQVAAVEEMISALPDTDASWKEIYDCGKAGKLTEANNAYAALAKVVIGTGATVDARSYLDQGLYEKLTALTCAYQEELNDIADAKTIKLGVESLYRKTSSGYQKTADDLTTDDEGKIAALEEKRDAMGESLLPAMTQAVIEETSASDTEAEEAAQELIGKIADARNKMTGLAGEDALSSYIESSVTPLLDSGDYNDSQKAEIESLIADAKAEINEVSNSDTLTQEEKEAKILEIIQNIQNSIAGVKNVYDLEAEAYEALINAYKAPDQVALSDKSAIENLRSKYEALSAAAQAQVNTDTLPNTTKTYITRLQELEKKISDLESALAGAKNTGKSALSNETPITPWYDRNIGYSNEYAGIYGMFFSGNFSSAKTEDLKSILSTALARIDNAANSSQIDTIVQDAVNQAEIVKDTARVAAEALEAKITDLGPVSDLSRTKADQVKALKTEYNQLSTKAKKHINTDKTSAGDTYKARLDALQKRIDKMAQDDANAVIKMIDALPSESKIKTSDEGKVTETRKAYAALTKEAKAKVSKEKLNNLSKAEALLLLEKKKEKLKADLKEYAGEKKKTTTYDSTGITKINHLTSAGVSSIAGAATEKAATDAKAAAIKKINAVKTTAQKLKETGVEVSFGKMHFRSVKQTKTALYFRWGKVSDINVFQIYGGKSGEEMKLIRQYDYKARSMKLKGLKKKTEYRYKLYACKVVDGEIIPVYASPVIYATTKGGKYGTVKSVKIKKIKTGKKTAKSKKKITLKAGKKAKISKKEKVTTNKKLKRRRKIKYESSNPKVAKVSSKGVITAVSPGKAKITVYSQSGQYKTIKVTVK